MQKFSGSLFICIFGCYFYYQVTVIAILSCKTICTELFNLKVSLAIEENPKFPGGWVAQAERAGPLIVKDLQHIYSKLFLHVKLLLRKINWNIAF